MFGSKLVFPKRAIPRMAKEKYKSISRPPMFATEGSEYMTTFIKLRRELLGPRSLKSLDTLSTLNILRMKRTSVFNPNPPANSNPLANSSNRLVHTREKSKQQLMRLK
mmetsp:Transcript_1077/g.2400  ORF Transcript_1077/g.2400 Transcript_1077/m.2400 type:complete len:108 (-) Transcript_1077:671-994(-)